MENWQQLLDDFTVTAERKHLLDKLEQVQHSEIDIVNVLFGEEYFRKILLDWLEKAHSLTSNKKCVNQATKLRDLGNVKFRRKEDTSSLLLYTGSVLHAPDGSEEQALALSNRSAALYHLQYYKECMLDIARVFRIGHPDHLFGKLLERWKNCVAKLGLNKETMESIEQCFNTINNQKASSTEECLILLSKLINEKNETLPQPVHGFNDSFMYASNALHLRYNEEKGRHVVTKEDLKMGDILFVEKPYILVVLPDYCKSHCHHCCATLLAPVACRECTQAVYCSEQCRQQSWNEYHQWECPVGLELCQKVGIAHLGLRVVLKADVLKRSKDFFTRMESNHEEKNVLKYGDKEENYSSVYCLLPHLEKMEPADIFQYSMTAVMLTHCLHQYTDYFTSKLNVQNCGRNENEMISFVGSLILRHIAQLVCNAHAITKLDKGCNSNSARNTDILTETQVRVATAIYPSASMMNHSCDPNIINSFCKQYLIVRASRDILKENEVYNCYGPHYRHMSFKSRQDVLKNQYFFSCSCDACSSPNHDFQEWFSALLCSKCGGPLLCQEDSNVSANKTNIYICSNCGNAQESQKLLELALKAEKLYEQGVEKLREEKVKEAISEFKACWKLQKKCLYKHNHQLCICTDQMAKCYAMLGDYEKSVEYLEQNLSAIEERFGSHSVELGNELQKLSDVMIQDLLKSGTREKQRKVEDCVKKAKAILEMHYGPWNSGLQEIEQKEKLLQQLIKNTHNAP